jgi:hypothetical protein
MSSVVRRGLYGVTAFAAGTALAGAGLAAPQAAAAPDRDPTLTIRVAGDRTSPNGAGVPNTAGLAGATFTVTPATLGEPDTCVSLANGTCTFNVSSNRTYTVTQTGVPGGWFSNTALGAGSIGPPSTVTPRTYNALTVNVGTANVTVPAAAPNTTTSPTARSGTWALSRVDPNLPDGCGLNIAVLFDLSASITQAILPTYKAAGRSLVDALKGTPSHIAIYTFGTHAPAANRAGSDNSNLVPPVSVADAAGVTTLSNKINQLGPPDGAYTNWDAGIWQIAADNPAFHYQAAIVLTDGDPTRYGPSNNLGGVTSPVTTRFAEVENGIFSANTLKGQGTSLLAVGIGASPSAPLQYVDNLRSISGTRQNTDFFTTDFNSLGTVLKNLALRNCAGMTITKTASPTSYDRVGQQITYTYAVTNTHFFTLHGVHVTDDHIDGPIPCTPSTLATGQTATCTARYTITQGDLDRGHLTNTARATGATPNDDPVTSDPADDTVKAQLEPAISLVKSAFPTEYSAPGERIDYTYVVTNTGNLTLQDIRLTDDRLGAITCPLSTLEPGQSMTCTGVHETTLADVDAGHIDNAATVTGDPPSGPPVTDTDTADVDAIHAPGIGVDKVGFPGEYGAADEWITFTYTVTNTGNETLRDITLTDDKLGPITCPFTALALGESMTCEGVHTVTHADVDAGQIVNTVVATGHPPTGPPVTATDEEVEDGIHEPGIELGKTAFPTEYGAAGERITYTYTVTNTGNVMLRHVALHDSRLGRITCPATTLAPGASMTCHATHVTTQADVEAGHRTNVAVATGDPPTGPPVTSGDEETVDAIHRPGIALEKTPSRTTYSEAGQAITYTYTVVNTGNMTLRDITVADSKVNGPIACAATVLAPGASTTCRATRTTTLADVTAGNLVNVATAAGRPPAGGQVKAKDEAIVEAILPEVPVTG